jgi:apolipoprotein D and lipocalin family protein
MIISATILVVGFGVVPLVAAGSGLSDKPELVPVSGFNLERYLGKWYEIARLPASFEKDLVNVTATYALRPDGKVKVINEGYKNTKDGKHKKAEGKAKFAKTPDIGHLKVSFFGPFYADYMVIVLDPDYQYAMVCSGHKYLWILARDPKLGKEILDDLVAKARDLGFKTDRLIYTPQD